MKITYTEHINKEVYLPHEAVVEVTKNKLKELLGRGEYLRTIKDEVWVYEDDPYHRHGSISEHPVRKATTLDLAIFEVLKACKNS